MRRLYTVCLYLLIPVILLRLYWKGRRLSAYRHRIAERFGCSKTSPPVVDVWLHAASLGEVVAATPLIDALLLKGWRVMVTTMTPTGSQHVVRCFGERVAHQYVPYDLPWVLRRFFTHMRARIGIIMETELWPNLIAEAKLARLSLVLANARISDKAFHQYQLVDFFFKPVLAQFSAILAQSVLDAERFLTLGAPKRHVHVLGNMKFDLQAPVSHNEQSAALKIQWGPQRPTLIAASTHEGEEQQFLERLQSLKTAIPGLLLLIAPRHPERFDAVYALSVREGFKTARRSQPETIRADLDVIILDTLGELLGFFQVSDYAFVGGSLVPIGGHNVLEPIAMHVPVFCGPYMQNSKAICAELCAHQALYLAKNADDLIQAVVAMYQQPALREQQIVNATAVLTANQGAVARHMQYIERL